MSPLPQSVVITAVKNEGPFLLQWVAWQQMLGFEHIVVMHNDCTDFSARLLKLLEAHGVLHQQRHWPAREQAPQRSAYDAAFKHPLVRGAEWALVTDVDERLVIHQGDGSLSALVDGGELPAQGININWRIFGTMGETAWSDRLLHRHYIRAARTDAQQNSCFKTIFRRPRDWDHLGSHGPKGWRGKGGWNTGDNRMLLSDGSRSPSYINRDWARNATARSEVVHGRAQISHYALQSVEQYGLKKGVPSAAMLVDRYDDSYYQRFDRNEVEDRSALKYADAFEAHYARLLAIPGVEALHHRSCLAYLEALAAQSGSVAEADPRYPYHQDRARHFRRLVKQAMAQAMA